MISVQEMQRQLVAYAMEETRNRALEEAASIIECRAFHWRGADLYDAQQQAKAIRAQKRDPAKQLSDWWGSEWPMWMYGFVPIGA